MRQPRITFLSYYYEPSQTVVARGEKQIERYIEKGFIAKKGGNGSFRMEKPSRAEIRYELDGIEKNSSVKEMIRNCYGIERVTNKRLETFFNDCKSGRVNFLDFIF